MIHRFPNYYNKFFCIADKCEATCCAGWQIVVDEDSLKKYKMVIGAFGQRIKEGVDFKEGVFYQNPGKRCAFLNRQNLCDMYIAMGEEAFCETCRKYPRHIEEFENVREFTLSASCPEAARILLAQKEPVQFYEVEVDAPEEEFEAWKITNFPDWDIMLEQLLVYFITTYFCGAVYDEYVASKVKMSVCSVFYIEELALAQWLKNAGTLTFQEVTRLVYRYSRELEHSDENLITMDRIMEEI